MPPSAFDGWFTTVVDRYERPLVAYALRYVHDLDAARDVVQDVFITLHGLAVQDQEGMAARLAPWLFTVCRNRCIDHQRSHAVSRKADAMDLATQTSSAAAPGAAIEHAETRSQVLAALSQLPPRQQEVLRLKFEQGLSYADIAAVTTLSVTNVGFLLSTGLATLRQQLAGAHS
jgi:RNA polymerase sigma factor (sigma-70 family)